MENQETFEMDCCNCNGIFEESNLINLNGNKYCEDCVNNLPTCCKCDEHLTESEINNFNGNIFCNECYDNIHECEDCGEKIDVENDNYIIVNGNYICKDCMDNYYLCEECEEYVNSDSIIHTCDNHYVCSDCINNNYFQCEDCGEWCRDHESNNVNDDLICDDCLGSHYFSCERCDEYHHYRDESPIDGICDDCYNDYYDEGDEYHVHEYGYKPEPDFHKLDNEYTKLYIGVELEIRGMYDHSCSNKLYHNVDFVYCKRDCSIGSDGIEIVSHPGTFDFHTKSNVWKEVFDILKENEMDDTSNCGLHFHISRNFFTEEAIKVLDYFVNNNSDFMAEHGGRSLEGYCKRNDKEISQWGNRSYSSHSDAINLTNKDTIEIRFCKSTPDHDTFMKRLKFIYDIVNFSMNISFKDIINGDNIEQFQKYMKDEFVASNFCEMAV